MTTPTERCRAGWPTSGRAGRGDIDAETPMFAEESYWRDLVSFTWNIKTLEGRDEIADMLRAQLDHVRPSGFTVVGEANEADGVTDAWIDFETAVARGHGQVRLRDDRCWTLLTTMVELKGLRGAARDGPAAGCRSRRGARTARAGWSASRPTEAALGYTEQPYAVIIGGGQGGIALGARLKQLDVPTIISRKPGPATRGGTATSRCASTTPCGTTTCRTSSSPRTGRSSRPRTRSPIGSRCTRR